MVVKEVAARDSRRFCSRRIRQWANSGKGIANIARGKLGLGKELRNRAQQIFNLFVRWRCFPRIVAIRHFGGADQNLFIPGKDEDRASIGGFGIESRRRSAGKARENDMRSADAADHWLRCANRGAGAHAIGPRAGTVDDPSGVDSIIFICDVVAQQDAARAALGYIDGEHFAVVADGCAGVGGFCKPLGDEALGEFTLRVFVIQNEPTVAGIEGAVHALQFEFANVACLLARNPLVEPQAGPNFHRAALALLVEQKEKMNRMDQMRTLAQQNFALANRFADKVEFAVFEITNPAVDNAGRAAGNSRGEVVLFDKQRALAGPGALTGNGDAIDAAADDHHLKMLRFQGWSRFYR